MVSGWIFADALQLNVTSIAFAGLGLLLMTNVLILDDIAWPKQAKAEFEEAAKFFNAFRNLTATGYWSSKVGVEDLQYIGNTVVPQWTGCPEPQLKKLGVSYT